MMLPLAYCCRVGYLDEVLFKYVVHTDSHSHTKRTLEQEYKRRDNFYKLQCETIDKIGTMQKNEKEYWKNYALTRSIFTKYRMAIYYHNFPESVKKQSELKERGVKILWKDTLNGTLYPDEQVVIYDIGDVKPETEKKRRGRRKKSEIEAEQKEN